MPVNVIESIHTVLVEFETHPGELADLCFLTFADIPNLRARLDFTGSQAAYVTHLIKVLSSYGRLPADNTHALIKLLEAVKAHWGTDKQAWIDRLIAEFEQSYAEISEPRPSQTTLPLGPNPDHGLNAFQEEDAEKVQMDPSLPWFKLLRFSKTWQVTVLLPTIAIFLILIILACEIVQAIFIPGLRDINDKQKQLETLMTGVGNNPNVLDQIDRGNNEIKARLKNLKATWDNLIFLPAISPSYIDDNWTDDPEIFRLMKTRFEMLVEALNRLLPVLYGALGATAYLLCVPIPHITLHTFNHKNTSSISISVRICLGMLSGVAIQWFFAGQQQAQIFERSLSTSALAFLAGYSVDLLFNIMDRFVQGFKIPKSPDKPESEARLL